MIGFGFASRWLKNWREIFKLITKRSHPNRVITFDSHLKTVLLESKLLQLEDFIPQVHHSKTNTSEMKNWRYGFLCAALGMNQI